MNQLGKPYKMNTFNQVDGLMAFFTKAAQPDGVWKRQNPKLEGENHALYFKPMMDFGNDSHGHRLSRLVISGL